MMNRRLRGVLVATAAVGVALAGTGTAYANDGLGGAPASRPGARSVTSDSCSGQPNADEKPLSVKDLGADRSREADSNSTKKDPRDAHGRPYYTHNQTCTNSVKFDKNKDDSYQTFRHNGRQNSYNDFDGYNDNYKYNNYDVNRCYVAKGATDHRAGECENNRKKALKDEKRYNPEHYKVNY
jgi:hypothetical protein